MNFLKTTCSFTHGINYWPMEDTFSLSLDIFIYLACLWILAHGTYTICKREEYKTKGLER